MDIALIFGAATLLFASVFITGLLLFFKNCQLYCYRMLRLVTRHCGNNLLYWYRYFFVLCFLTLYWWLPNTKLQFGQVWPTALAGAAAFEISKVIFIFYLRNASGVATSIYGGLSTIIVLMIFVYVSSIILLVGAMLTSRYAFYLAQSEQKKRNRSLSKSLERIRGTSSLLGMPNPTPAGVDESEVS
ncbi:MAG: hypothetical protein CM1200mP39_14110 [Dehalococcoidia bacterium]|nr:MAG: hypothetical protein CM1200mP39_14110 [Dehalococcoidia bacterium]